MELDLQALLRTVRACNQLTSKLINYDLRLALRDAPGELA